MEDYETEKWFFRVERTDTQGNPCRPFYSVRIKSEYLKRIGLENNIKTIANVLKVS